MRRRATGRIGLRQTITSPVLALARETSGLRRTGRMMVTRADMSAPQTDHDRWFLEQVHPHESALRAYLRSIFPSMVDIDDLVQESYVRIIRAKEAGKISYVKAFLFSTARNLALDIFRRKKVISIDGVANLDDLSVLDEKPDIGDALDRQDELSLLAQSVRSLPERCRQVLTLRLLYGFSHKEISARLGISEHTVKAQLAKGMRRCAEYLSRRGILAPNLQRSDP